MKTKTIICWRCEKSFSATVEDLASFPSECPGCLERIAARDRQELERVAERSAAKDSESIEARIAKMTPAAFKKTNCRRLPQAQMQEVLRWEFGAKGLILIGPSGLGKTRCLWLLVHQLMREKRNVIFLRETDLSHQVARRGHLGTLWDWIDKLCDVEVLVIDDLGKAPRTDRFISELFHIVDTRLNEERPLLISTQLNGAAVGDQIAGSNGVHAGEATAAALVRRLREACQEVVFKK